MTTARTPIRIVIDELIVRGLDGPEARAASALLQSELAGLAITSDRTQFRSRAVGAAGPLAVNVREGSGASVGRAVAGAVWDHVNGERK